MATPSLLLLRRLRASPSCYSSVIRRVQRLPCAMPFSSSVQPLWQPDPASPLPPAPPPPSDPKAGLSARMSFVFDQIDAMERARGAKDEALQRIRAWRETKQQQDGADGDGGARGIDLEAVTAAKAEGKRMVVEQERENVFRKEVELVHPWPEWIELMELLVKQNYFDHRRFDEGQMVRDLPIDLSGIAEDVGLDFTRDWVTVRTACLNFGRDRFDILRSLSRKDLQILVGNGCPSTDKKVVFSAKLLRKLAHLDEGDVCSACKLRSTCTSGYLLTKKEDEARTLDVMRILLTFAFDSINSSVENKALLKMKSVKTIARKLLHDIVKLGAVPIDPNLPLPVIKRPPPKVKQPPTPPKKRVGRDDIEMKKGDWLCPKCDFMNFAKNTVCLQCDAKRPKRQLLPGEWECPECNFLNYRRNMACFHCDHKRPPDEFTENKMQFKHQGLHTRLERPAGLSNFANGWNFDFDDNESDGADVAAFEFADPPRMSDNSLDGPPQRGVTRGFDDRTPESNSMPRVRDRGEHFTEPDEKAFPHAPRTGFDDFEDEDDDVDCYEIDDRPVSPIREVAHKNMPEFENSAGSEDFDDFESDYKPHGSFNADSTDSDGNDQNIDSDSDVSNHPQWRSFKKTTWTSGESNQNRRMPHDSQLYSDFDDNSDREYSSKERRGVARDSHARDSGRMRNHDSDDDLFGSDSQDYGYLHSNGHKARGNGGKRNTRGNGFRESDNSDAAITRNFETRSGMSNRGTSFGNTHDDWPYGGPDRKARGVRANNDRAQRERNEKYGLRGFDRPRGGQFECKQDRKSNLSSDTARRSDEYRQGRRSNHWNNRSTGF